MERVFPKHVVDKKHCCFSKIFEDSVILWVVAASL